MSAPANVPVIAHPTPNGIASDSTANTGNRRVASTMSSSRTRSGANRSVGVVFGEKSQPTCAYARPRSFATVPVP